MLRVGQVGSILVQMTSQILKYCTWLHSGLPEGNVYCMAFPYHCCQMDDLVQHEEHSHRDSIDVLDRFRGPLCLHGSLESEDNLYRNVAHAAPHRPNVNCIAWPPP